MDSNPSRFRICVARLIDAGVVLWITLILIDRFEIQSPLLSFDISGPRTGEIIRDHLIFLGLYFVTWFAYEFCFVRCLAQTLGMILANIAIVDLDNLTGVCCTQVFQRMRDTIRNVSVVMLTVLIGSGIEAILLPSSSLVICAYFITNNRGSNIHSASRTIMIHKVAKEDKNIWFYLDNIGIYLVGSIAMLMTVLILLASTLWLLVRSLA